MHRYPAPDPSDPWAPLWVLRSKAASSTASTRPSTADSLPPPVNLRPTPRPRSSPGYLSGSTSRRLFDDRGRYTVTSPSTGSPLASSILLSASPPQSPRSSQSRPSLPSLSDAISRRENRQQAQEIASKDQARAQEFVHGHDKPRKRSQNKFSRLFLGSIKASMSPGSNQGLRENRPNSIALPRERTNSQPDPPHHQKHYWRAKPHHRALSSNARPMISPPVLSTVVWESQMTGRKFVPIAASPIMDHATSVQQPEHVVTPFNAVLNDEAATSARDDCRMAIVGSDEHNGGATGIKSPAPSTASRPLSPPHRPSSDMHDDSGAELQASQDMPIPSASPHTPRKRVPSLRVATSPSQRSSQSSYFEIFSTPCGSPFEPESPLKEGSGETCPRAAPSSPSAPRSPESPTPALLFPPMTATSAQTPLSASSMKAQCCPTTITVPVFQGPIQTEWSIPSPDQLAYAASLPIYQSDGTPIEFGSLFSEYRTIVLFLRHFFCPLCQDYVETLVKLIKQPVFKETGAICPFDEADARVAVNGHGDDGQALPKQVQLVLISCGKASLVGKYKNMFQLPFRMYTDPDMKVYEALGMGKMGSTGGGSGDKHAHARADVERGAEKVEVVRTISPMATATRRSYENGSYVKHGLMGGIGMVVMRALKVGMPMWENGGDIAQLGGEFVLGPGMTCAFAHRMQDPKGHAPVLEVLKAANVNIPDEYLRTLGGAVEPTSLTSLSESDLSSILFAPPSNVGGQPGPSETVPLKGNDSQLVRKKSKSMSVSSASTVRRSGSLKALSSLVTPSPPLDSLALHGYGNSNARALKRLGISSKSVDENAGIGGKKSARRHYHTYSSLKNAEAGSGKEYRRHSNDDRRPRAGDTQLTAIPLPPLPIPESRSLVEEEQTWMESRQRDLEALRQRKDARRRTGTSGSVSLSGRGSSMSLVPLKGVGVPAGGAYDHGHPTHSQGYGSFDMDSGYNTGLSSMNGYVGSSGCVVDESGVLVRPRGDVFVHDFGSPPEDEDTAVKKAKKKSSRSKSFSASVRSIFRS